MTSTTDRETLVVFDWNGTIMDDVSRATNAMNHVLSHYDRDDITEDDVRRTFRLPMTDWTTALGLPDEAADLWSVEVSFLDAAARPEAHAVLLELRSAGVVVGVASAASEAAVVADARRCGLLDVIDLLATGVSDKTEYLRSVRRLADRAVYVGDCEYDVECARAAGFEAVAIAGGYRSVADLESAMPDVVVTDLGDVAGLVTATIRS